MPSTLAHFGVQGFLTRAAVPTADPRWVLLGCVIPDMPWILQRLVNLVGFGTDPYQLRVYAMTQASLLFSLLLCGSFSLLSRSPRRTFVVLGLGALLHLLLDAAETKWGNGVHLFVPFSWELTNFGWFWPESPVAHLLTALGIGYLAWAWRAKRGGRVRITPPSLDVRGSVTAGALLLAYLMAPPAFNELAMASDSHFVSTLSHRESRRGKTVAFDRDRILRSGKELHLRTYAGERLPVANDPGPQPGRVSVRATFVTADTIMIHELHSHHEGAREYGSYAGLLLLLVFWIVPRRR